MWRRLPYPSDPAQTCDLRKYHRSTRASSVGSARSARSWVRLPNRRAGAAAERLGGGAVLDLRRASLGSRVWLCSRTAPCSRWCVVGRSTDVVALVPLADRVGVVTVVPEAP